jgi:arginine repressor
MKLEERAEEKRKELTDIVKDVIQNYDIQNKEKIASEIINHFVNITPPEMEERVGTLSQ